MVSVWDLVEWGLWVVTCGGVRAVIATVAAGVLGREGVGRFFLDGLLAIVVGAFGWAVITSAAPAANGQWDWIYLMMAGALMTVAGTYLALGRLEEGGRHVLYAFLVVGLMAFASAVGGSSVPGPAGGLKLGLGLTATTLESGGELGLSVSLSGVVTYPARVDVSWGDGVNTTDLVVEEGGVVALTHTYVVSGEAARAFTIVAHAVDSAGREGFSTVTVVVQNPGYCPYPWYLGFLCPLVSGVKWAIPGLDLVKLVTPPEFPTSEGDPVYETYEAVLTVSLSALGLYLALGLAFGAFEGRVLEVFKDAVVALTLALIIPWVDPLAPAAGLIAAGLAVGYFVPAAANLASALILVMMLLSAVVVIRYVLILALIAGFPLVAVASTHPLLRGVFRHVVNLMAGLITAGPLVAVFLKILTAVTPGGELTISVTYPLVGVIVPNLLSPFGAGALGGVGEAVLGGVRRLAGVAGGAAGAGVAAGAAVNAARLARVPAPAAAQATASNNAAGTTTLRPVLTSATLRTSWRGATLSRGVSEGVNTTTPGMRAFIESAEAGGRAAEAAAKELGLDSGLFKAVPPQQAEVLRGGVELAAVEAVQQAMRESYARAEREAGTPNPTAEALKAFAKTLATQSWSQLRTNARLFATQLSQNLMQELEARASRTRVRSEDARAYGGIPAVSRKEYVRV